VNDAIAADLLGAPGARSGIMRGGGPADGVAMFGVAMFDSADQLFWYFGHRKRHVTDATERVVGTLDPYVPVGYRAIVRSPEGAIAFALAEDREQTWWGYRTLGPLRVVDGEDREFGSLTNAWIRVDDVPVAQICRVPRSWYRYEILDADSERPLASVRSRRGSRRCLELLFVDAVHGDLRTLVMAATFAIRQDIIDRTSD
jgi:hypothetical protein